MTAPTLSPADTPADRLPTLTASERRRYSRHLLLPEIGPEGQARLKQARVLCVGTGGLGSPLLLYLAAAGVGTIGIIDHDIVDDSNLQRQIVHGTSTVGVAKVTSAAARLRDLNPDIAIEVHDAFLTRENAMALVAQYDVVADGTDNFPTRYLVNDACVLLGKPNIYGSIFRFDGQVSVFWAEHGPCYRCLFREPPPPGLVPSCAEGGVLGVLPGIIGSMQALEVIKVLLGIGDALIGRMLLFDALAMQWQEVHIRKDAECPICGVNPTITAPIDYQQFCGIGTAPDAGLASITAREAAAQLQPGHDCVLIDVREPHEWAAANLAERGAQLVPLGTFPDTVATWPRDRRIIVHCRAGARSAKAVRQLLDAGYTDVWNLEGGILAWRDTVDASKDPG